MKCNGTSLLMTAQNLTCIEGQSRESVNV